MCALIKDLATFPTGAGNDVAHNDLLEIQRQTNNNNTEKVEVSRLLLEGGNKFNQYLHHVAGEYHIRYSAIRITASVFQVTVFLAIAPTDENSITVPILMPEAYRPNSRVQHKIESSSSGLSGSHLIVNDTGTINIINNHSGVFSLNRQLSVTYLTGFTVIP